jgi:hypothetical protein
MILSKTWVKIKIECWIPAVSTISVAINSPRDITNRNQPLLFFHMDPTNSIEWVFVWIFFYQTLFVMVLTMGYAFIEGQFLWSYRFFCLLMDFPWSLSNPVPFSQATRKLDFTGINGI